MGSSAVKRIVAALCLCLVAAFVSGLLLLQHHGEPVAVATVNEACGDGQTSGCEDVARSSWSSFAGIPVAALGLVFYLSLASALVLALLGPAELRELAGRLVLASLALGLLVDILLFAVQAFAIKAYCTLCISTYVLGGLALLALVPAWRGGAAAGLAGRPERRLAAGSWVMTVLAIAGGVLAADAGLTARAARRQAGLLGAPVAAAVPHEATAPPAAPGAQPPAAAPAPPAGTATPAATPTAAGPQDTAYWQKRAQQLQETLDDPRKLETYFTEKAQREFDTAQVAAIDMSSAPVRGPANAPVKVVEYSDFLCPFCRNLATALTQFLPQAGGRLSVHFKNYPLDASCNSQLKTSVHPGACVVALGAVCAQRQGKFEAYHDKVFSTELRNPQPSDVVRLAGEAGLDGAALQSCLADPKAKEALAADIAEAHRLQVNSTPTLYINGKKLPRINDFVAVVDKEAQKKGFPPLNAR